MPETGPTPTATEKLLEAAARVLAPLARLLIARGVTFQMASELLKRVYVRAAQKHFVDEGGATGTRLSLLTGLNRKEIRRLTELESAEQPPIPMASYAGAVFEVWRTQRQWRGKDGNPRTLPRRTTGTESSFDDLVKSVTTDHRPSAVLDELLRLGIVEPGENDQLRLSATAFVPQRSFEDQVTQLSQGVEDHMNAAVTNVLENQPRFMERMVFSDELSILSAEELHNVVRAHWQRIHDDVVEKAITAEARDREQGNTTTTRMRVGMYFYSETEENG
jgi:hypothetical protein